MADIQSSLDTEKEIQISMFSKENPTQEVSSFLKLFFELKDIQIDLLPQIQLSEDDRKDLEEIIMRSDYICKCYPQNFLVKRDQWTICSYQYLVLAKEAYSFANQLNTYCKFFNEIQDQEDLKILYNLKRSIHEDIKKMNKKKGIKTEESSDEIDPDEVPLNIDKKIVLETLNSPNILEELNKTKFFKSYNGDKNSLRDFLLNPQVKQIISKKKNDIYKQRSDVFSSNILTAFPIVVAHNGFLGDLVYFLANNDNDYLKIIDIVGNIKQTTTPLLGGNLFQEIFFGAPGTGKSHRIDYDLFRDENGNSIGKGIKEISKDRKFRTTFHPDYDYAQFIGAYKPRESKKTPLLNKEELLRELKKFLKEQRPNPVHKFSAFYFESLENLSTEDKKDLFDKANVPHSMQEAEVPKGLSVGKYFDAKKQISSITYSFVPQVFAKAYIAAWKHFFNASNALTADNQVYLVIEEINRGNCAQIFGDIFQLLDRVNEGSAKGFSRYSIDADYDFAKYIEDELKAAGKWNDYKSAAGEGKLKLPPNLNILATMNTSDQSLFPMDSAFKRRFDWEYVPINYKMPKADFKVGKGDLSFDWLHFLKKVNADIRTVTESEDKQMGEFFIEPKDNGPITLEEFRSKVLFYLWDTVYKDETDKKNLFHFPYPEKGPGITFQRLFEEDEAGKLSDNSKKIIRKMLETLDAAYDSEEYNDFKIFPVKTEPTEDK